MSGAPGGEDFGKLVYSTGRGSRYGRLCHRWLQDGTGADYGKLLYKSDTGFGGKTRITFAWGSDGSDLDICAFWDARPGLKYGYGYINGGGGWDASGSGYYIYHSGDRTGSDDAEWVDVERLWSGAPATFTIYLNFFGYDADNYPASTCTVIAAQETGETKVLRDVPCGTERSSRALPGHGGVRIHFDSSGFLERMTTAQGV